MRRTLLLLIIAIIYGSFSYAQSGAGWEWASVSGVATYSPGRQLLDIATDASGNVYAVGRFQGTLTLGSSSINTSGDGTDNYNFDEDGFVVKYNSSGAVQWLQRIGKTAVGSNEDASFIKLDDNGNVYVGISNGGIVTSGLDFLIKFDNNGNQLWSKLGYSISALNVKNGFLYVTGNDKLNKFDLDGNEIWSVSNAGKGATDTFVDDFGNSYLITIAQGGNGNLTFLGQSFTPSGLASSYIGKVGANGMVQWIQEIKGRSTAHFTIDKNGKSYIWLTGGFGDVFQGVSTNNISGNSYFELNNTGTISRYLKLCPYKGAFKVKDDGVYSCFLEVGSSLAKPVAYGDYFVNIPTDPTLGLGVAIKYNKLTDVVEKLNTCEIKGASSNPGAIYVAQITQNGKMLLGGSYGTYAKFGNATHTFASSSGYAPTDLFLVQFDLSLAPQPEITNWTGAAGDGMWNNAANWDNGIPNGTKKTNILAGLSGYPTAVPADATPAKLEIAAGAKVQLPLNFSAPFGIINNGAIEINETGTFTGTFGATAIAPTGTGKITLKNAGLTFYFSGGLNQSLELDFNGTASSYGGTINGDLILTKGLVSISFELYPFLVNGDVVGGSQTSYVAGKLVRKVNATGNYNFPVGATDRYAPVNLQLNNIVGPQTISTGFSKTINGSNPNTVISGQTVTTLLNTGIWTISPDATLTAGSYSVTLNGTGFNNAVADAAKYVVLKRTNSSAAWGFYGDNGLATQTAAMVTATAANITGFSDFAIGIANGAVTTTLPIKLVKFTVKTENAAILLNWQTSSELNNDSFIIERSLDGKNFAPIGEVKGNGTTNMVSFYSWRDNEPKNGNNYYRLKQVESNDEYEYSEVKIAKFSLSNGEIKIYPNPVSKSFKIFNAGNVAALAHIYDFSGRQLVTIKSVNNEFYLPNQLNNGTYLIKVFYDDVTVSQHKIIVSR